MTASEWLTKHERSIAWLARQTGVTRSHMSRVVGGKAMPSALLAKSIERITDGAVPVSVWGR